MSRDCLISVCVKCKMFGFCVVKYDFFYAREALFSIKLICKMSIIDIKLLNYESIVQSRNSLEAFQRSTHIGGLCTY